MSRAAPPSDLAEWTYDRVKRECSKPYRAFHKDIRARHIAYYAKRPAERSENPKRPFVARERRFTFSPGWEDFAQTASTAPVRVNGRGGDDREPAIGGAAQ